MNYRPSARRVAAVTMTALLVAGAAPAAASAAESAGDVTEGSLDWGVKESFRTYVVSPAASGEIEVLAGASQNSDGTFHFGGGSGTVAEIGFTGGVRFTGHDGALEIIVSDPVIQIDGDTGILLADASSLGQDGELAELPDVALASLDLSGASLEPDASGVITVEGAAATLSDAGAPAFGGFYEAGEALDPVSFTLQTSAAGEQGDGGTAAGNADGDVPAGDAGDNAADGDALPKTGAPWLVLAVGGLVLVAIGAAFVLLGRRRGGETVNESAAQ